MKLSNASHIEKENSCEEQEIFLLIVRLVLIAFWLTPCLAYVFVNVWVWVMDTHLKSIFPLWFTEQYWTMPYMEETKPDEVLQPSMYIQSMNLFRNSLSLMLYVYCCFLVQPESTAKKNTKGSSRLRGQQKGKCLDKPKKWLIQGVQFGSILGSKLIKHPSPCRGRGLALSRVQVIITQ